MPLAKGNDRVDQTKAIATVIGVVRSLWPDEALYMVVERFPVDEGPEDKSLVESKINPSQHGRFWGEKVYR